MNNNDTLINVDREQRYELIQLLYQLNEDNNNLKIQLYDIENKIIKQNQFIHSIKSGVSFISFIYFLKILSIILFIIFRVELLSLLYEFLS